MAMSYRPTVFIVSRKNDKKEPTISKAEMDEHIARAETIMRYRNKQEEFEHDIPPINPPSEQISVLFNNLHSDKSHALPFSPSGLSYDYWRL